MEPQSSSSPKANIQKLAINAALNCSWEEAFKLNRQILRLEPQNIDAQIRLARVCFELGKLEQAKKYYHQALKIDPYNPIALKNLKIIKAFKGNEGKRTSHHTLVTPNMFLHEPGKTKVVVLSKVAEPQKLSHLYPGMQVTLMAKSRSMNVLDHQNQYLGVLPDDVSYLLTKLIKGGNKYNAIVKSVRVNGLSVLIRESFRSSRFKNRPSFLENGVKFQNSSFSSSQTEEVLEITEEE